MAIDNDTPRSNVRMHLEVVESPFGPYGLDGVLVGFLDASTLPAPLRRLHERTAVVRLIKTTIREEDLPFKPLVWLILFPRSRGQDLLRDFSGMGTGSFPVVLYGYEGELIKGPLMMARLHDMGLGIVELSK